MTTHTNAEAKSTSPLTSMMQPAHSSLLSQQEQEEPDRSLRADDWQRSSNPPTPPPINPSVGHNFGSMAIGSTTSPMLQRMAIANKNLIQRQENTEEEEPIQTKAIASLSVPLLQRQINPEEEEEKTIQTKAFPEQGLTRFSQRYGQMVTQAKVRSMAGVPVLQRKLAIGQPNDPYEQEADRVADAVMRMPDSRTMGQGLVTRSLREGIDRQCTDCEDVQPKLRVQRSSDDSLQAEEHLESQLSRSKGGGSPLSDEVRSFMEPRFGTDFSQVRVHIGSDSVQMNQELRAQAFTHGNDIYYGQGKAPTVDALTAHELTHVVQQTCRVQPQVDQQPKQVVSSKSTLISKGQTPSSQVLTHLQSLGKAPSHDSALYRQEILQFQQKNPTEKIAISQQKVLEQQPPVDIQHKDNSSTLRRCGGGSSPSIAAQQVEFTSSHALTSHSGDPKVNPMWRPGAVDHAAAYTKSTNPVLNARFVNVGSSLPGVSATPPPSVSVRVKEGGVVRGTKTGITPTGNAIDITGLTLSGLTGSTEVRASNYSLIWEGSTDGISWTPMTMTGLHRVYWLYAAPLAGPLYNFAVSKATTYASGASDVPAAIRSGLRGDVSYDPADPINPDPLTVYADGVGICTDFGNLLTYDVPHKLDKAIRESRCTIDQRKY